MTTATIQTKSLTADMQPEEGSREMIVRITSDALDRDGEVLLPGGMDYKEFMQNPIVFANHEYGVRDVVGKVLKMSKDKDGWIAKVLMIPRPPGHEGEWLADTILHNARYGIMGVSVGFTVLDSRKPSKKDIEQFGETVQTVFTRWKLLELSIAPLPANQEALILAVSKGMDRAAVKRFYPKTVLPSPTVRVSLIALVKAQWAKGAPVRTVENAIRLAIAKRRGKMFAD